MEIWKELSAGGWVACIDHRVSSPEYKGGFIGPVKILLLALTVPFCHFSRPGYLSSRALAIGFSFPTHNQALTFHLLGPGFPFLGIPETRHAFG